MSNVRRHTTQQHRFVENMRKTHLLINTTFIALMLYVLIASTRRSHTVEPQLLLGLIPPISALLLVRYPNRNLGAVAVISNGMVFLGGIICAIAFALGAGATGSTRDRLVLPAMVAFFLVAGYTNTSYAWRSFPPEKTPGDQNPK
jgi:peptidoglycan/LPS O-acetylase OafA/YrhL